MSSQDYLLAACRLLTIQPEQIIGQRLEDDTLHLIVDYGIAGGKKLSLSLDSLTSAPEPEPPVKAQEPAKVMIQTSAPTKVAPPKRKGRK